MKEICLGCLPLEDYRHAFSVL